MHDTETSSLTSSKKRRCKGTEGAPQGVGAAALVTQGQQLPDCGSGYRPGQCMGPYQQAGVTVGHAVVLVMAPVALAAAWRWKMARWATLSCLSGYSVQLSPKRRWATRLMTWSLSCPARLPFL